MTRDENREIEQVSNVLQVIKDEPRFAEILLRNAPPKSDLLELVGTVTLPATTERFVASKKFVVGKGPDARVKICGLGSNFENWFLNKVEESIGETTLCFQRLRKASRDTPIINELGGEEKAETTLTEIYALMERQKNGEKGILLTNGNANIFYAPDINGVLRAVFVDWYGWGGGWSVSACGVEGPGRWLGGLQVFSRNC